MLADYVLIQPQELHFIVKEDGSSESAQIFAKNTSVTNTAAFKIKVSTNHVFVVQQGEGFLDPGETKNIDIKLKSNRNPDESVITRSKFLVEVKNVTGLDISRGPKEFWSGAYTSAVGSKHLLACELTVCSPTPPSAVSELATIEQAAQNAESVKSAPLLVVDDVDFNTLVAIEPIIVNERDEMGTLKFYGQKTERTNRTVRILNKSESFMAYKMKVSLPQVFTIKGPEGFIPPNSESSVGIQLRPLEEVNITDMQIKLAIDFSKVGSDDLLVTSKQYWKNRAGAKPFRIVLTCVIETPTAVASQAISDRMSQPSDEDAMLTSLEQSSTSQKSLDHRPYRRQKAEPLIDCIESVSLSPEALTFCEVVDGYDEKSFTVTNLSAEIAIAFRVKPSVPQAFIIKENAEGFLLPGEDIAVTLYLRNLGNKQALDTSNSRISVELCTITDTTVLQSSAKSFWKHVGREKISRKILSVDIQRLSVDTSRAERDEKSPSPTSSENSFDDSKSSPLLANSGQQASSEVLTINNDPPTTSNGDAPTSPWISDTRVLRYVNRPPSTPPPPQLRRIDSVELALKDIPRFEGLGIALDTTTFGVQREDRSPKRHVHFAEKIIESEVMIPSVPSPVAITHHPLQPTGRVLDLLIKNIDPRTPLAPQEIVELKAAREGLKKAEWERWLDVAREEQVLRMTETRVDHSEDEYGEVDEDDGEQDDSEVLTYSPFVIPRPDNRVEDDSDDSSDSSNYVVQEVDLSLSALAAGKNNSKVVSSSQKFGSSTKSVRMRIDKNISGASDAIKVHQEKLDSVVASAKGILDALEGDKDKMKLSHMLSPIPLQTAANLEVLDADPDCRETHSLWMSTQGSSLQPLYRIGCSPGRSHSKVLTSPSSTRYAFYIPDLTTFAFHMLYEHFFPAKIVCM